MVNAKVYGVNQNYKNGSDDIINKLSSTDVYQARRGNSILDGFGQTYRFCADAAVTNGNDSVNLNALEVQPVKKRRGGRPPLKLRSEQKDQKAS